MHTHEFLNETFAKLCKDNLKHQNKYFFFFKHDPIDIKVKDNSLIIDIRLAKNKHYMPNTKIKNPKNFGDQFLLLSNLWSYCANEMLDLLIKCTKKMSKDVSYIVNFTCPNGELLGGFNRSVNKGKRDEDKKFYLYDCFVGKAIRYYEEKHSVALFDIDALQRSSLYVLKGRLNSSKGVAIDNRLYSAVAEYIEYRSSKTMAIKLSDVTRERKVAIDKDITNLLGISFANLSDSFEKAGKSKTVDKRSSKVNLLSKQAKSEKHGDLFKMWLKRNNKITSYYDIEGQLDIVNSISEDVIDSVIERVEQGIDIRLEYAIKHASENSSVVY